MMDKRKQAKALRKQGLTYWQIGDQIGVSGVTARRYILDIKSSRPDHTQREGTRYLCRVMKPDTRMTCERIAGHDGIHLANDRKDKLVYWS